jgi:antitoxin component YwqK of YwqJK toxin-antitoxin module
MTILKKIQEYQDGSKQVFHYKNGKLHGSSEMFYPNGNCESKKHFLNGKLHGVCLWYGENGDLICIEHYRNDEEIGVGTMWKVDGSYFHHEDGTNDGRASGFYDADGVLHELVNQ